MPTSWHHVISTVLELLVHTQPKSILDIGIGFGKYGVLIRDALEIPEGRYHKSDWQIRLDGVEVFSPYRNPIHDYVYDNVWYNDIFDIIDQLPNYDVILLIDVLEHFNKERGFELISSLLNKTRKFLLISTPAIPSKQDGYLGNAYERHLSIWSPIDFINYDYSYCYIPCANNGAHLICIMPHQQKMVPHIIRDREAKVKKLMTSMSLAISDPLTIAYLLPHNYLTGGLKILLQQMDFLKKRGHKIIALAKGDQNTSIIPSWFKIDVDEEIRLRQDESFSRYLKGCDIIVAGWFTQIPEVLSTSRPVVYLEQGNGFLFGDYNDLSPTSPIRTKLQFFYSLPCYIATVSPLLATVIKTRFGRDAFVIPIGVDTNVFTPGKRPNDGTILLVGNPLLRFKGFDIALQAVNKVKEAGLECRLKWICQVKPKIIDTTIPIDFIVSPSQTELAAHYRESDILLFTSWYEGFGLPPLEAMSSGVPVVTTDCGGIRTYAVHGLNALIAPPGDVDSLAYWLIYLLKREHVRAKLSANGRETALRFSMHNHMLAWETFLRTVVMAHNS